MTCLSGVGSAGSDAFFSTRLPLPFPLPLLLLLLAESGLVGERGAMGGRDNDLDGLVRVISTRRAAGTGTLRGRSESDRNEREDDEGCSGV